MVITYPTRPQTRTILLEAILFLPHVAFLILHRSYTYTRSSPDTSLLGQGAARKDPRTAQGGTAPRPEPSGSVVSTRGPDKANSSWSSSTFSWSCAKSASCSRSDGTAEIGRKLLLVAELVAVAIYIRLYKESILKSYLSWLYCV